MRPHFRVSSCPTWSTCLFPLFLVAVCSDQVAGAGSVYETTCPTGSWLDASSGVCAPERVRQPPDMREMRLAVRFFSDLRELRAGKTRQNRGAGNEMPVPGGLGSGVNFEQGSLQVLDSADLQTTMYVHPNGVAPSEFIDYLFTTSTNRTDLTIELVGSYSGATGAAILLWDWSCSPTHPCPNSSTQAGWQLTLSFSALSCSIENIIDAGGHPQQAIRYSNSSIKEDRGSPPLWRNRVRFWNFCDAAWDLIYEHAFRADQRDCSLDNACGYWGPIIETFGLIPQILELGFEDSVLIHDGLTSLLPPGDASFTAPHDPCTGESGDACWTLCHLEPNRGFGVGNDCPAGSPTPTPTAEPDGWTLCANESPCSAASAPSVTPEAAGLECRFTGTKTVRYGANGRYTYRTTTGPVACNNCVFGDPVFGVVKHCDYRDPFTPTPTATPTATITAEPPRPCFGDCDDSGAVEVTDIVKMVNIVLEAGSVSMCRTGVNQDGMITVREIVKAVKNLIEDCSA